MLKHQAGKAIEDQAIFTSPEAMLDVLLNITEKQIANVKKGILPIPPVSMGNVWDPRCTAEEILEILKNTYCINLNNLAVMVGFSSDEASQIFGLGDNAGDILTLNQKVSQRWEEESSALVLGVEQFLDAQHAKFSEQWKASGISSQNKLEAHIQPSGVHLGNSGVVNSGAPALVEFSMFSSSCRHQARKACLSSFEDAVRRLSDLCA